MTALELHALSYWRAQQARRNPRLGPIDRAMVADQLHALATSNTGRVRELARAACAGEPGREDGDGGRAA